ncbi:hypothetical protein BS78_03G193100 [Paspalum vaginatum]|nr:hypothetical protein BS78_03G193100 [Paspalum vaginatum]KAJ1284287.1 hypothetical protein BS78_03G193100 [Paspalum vaginatum]KAJ1284289.1 hypothetical protein BS78_03G193100 [Paspalum vaginatum]KAJ1284290.1 hypothetical protein BS78_03G193100 [Paspalum vaginatum]
MRPPAYLCRPSAPMDARPCKTGPTAGQTGFPFSAGMQRLRLPKCALPKCARPRSQMCPPLCAAAAWEPLDAAVTAAYALPPCGVGGPHAGGMRLLPHCPLVAVDHWCLQSGRGWSSAGGVPPGGPAAPTLPRCGFPHLFRWCLETWGPARRSRTPRRRNAFVYWRRRQSNRRLDSTGSLRQPCPVHLHSTPRYRARL